MNRMTPRKGTPLDQMIGNDRIVALKVIALYPRLATERLRRLYSRKVN